MKTNLDEKKNISRQKWTISCQQLLHFLPCCPQSKLCEYFKSAILIRSFRHRRARIDRVHVMHEAKHEFTRRSSGGKMEATISVQHTREKLLLILSLTNYCLLRCDLDNAYHSFGSTIRQGSLCPSLFTFYSVLLHEL